MMWNRWQGKLLASSILRIVILIIAAQVVAGCPQAANWRDRQISESAKIATGSWIEAPDPPIVVPAKIAKKLPLHMDMTVVEFTEQPTQPKEVSIKLISGWSTEQTALWVYQWLNDNGYSSDSGPSAILAGDVYRKHGAEYHEISVNVSENTANQCIITIGAKAG